jgi:uncharacterized protein (TIGR02145 family)
MIPNRLKILFLIGEMRYCTPIVEGALRRHGLNSEGMVVQLMSLRMYIIILGFLMIGCNGSELDKPVDKSEPLSVSTVQIGDQIWMAENLSLRHYQNGDSIAFAETAEDLIRYGHAAVGAWMYPNGDSTLVEEYGLLYNWFAVTDERGIYHEGWHVPSDEDWQQLAEYLGVDSAGTQLKVTEYWKDDGGGSNSSGFAALPAGFRHIDGKYEGYGIYGSWWTSTILEEDSYFVLFRGVGNYYDHIYRDRTSKYLGMSLRMIKN